MDCSLFKWKLPHNIRICGSFFIGIRMTNQLNWIKGNFVNGCSWALTIGWLVFIYNKIHTGNLPVNLNEFGDFIAGAFAPLAFFWLVRGFYQQGKGLEQNSTALKIQAEELTKSTEALKLQVQEMKASVEQQSRLAKFYEEELKQKHFQVQPYFEYNFMMMSNCLIDEAICDEDNCVVDVYKERVITFSLTIKNIGNTARNLFIKSRKDQPRIQKRQYKFEHLEEVNIRFEVYSQFAEELNEGIRHLSRIFQIKYQDIYGKNYEQYIECSFMKRIEYETGQISGEEVILEIISKEDALA